MSATEDYFVEVLRGKRGFVPSVLRGIATVLSPVYNGGLELYLLPYNTGIRKRARLACPVICVGNLTTGGTGKTPMTQTLCRFLLAEGKRVTILSRGYGGQNEYGCAVVSDGEKVLLTATEAGDEAFLLAQTLPGVPVVVGKDRRVTGKLACERFAPDVIVLDDGMQFWQLHRDLDIVLLNACDPFDNGWTFPRGLLREPKSHLHRAGIVVLTNAERANAEQISSLRKEVERLAPNRPVFTAGLAPSGLRSLPGGEIESVSWLSGKRIAAFSALGNPASFESLLEAQGAVLVTRTRFRDHRTVAPDELEAVFTEAVHAGAEAVLTTEKDAVKLPPQTFPLPLLTLQVTLQINDEKAFHAAVLSKLSPM